jgi:hypothetical protein
VNCIPGKAVAITRVIDVGDVILRPSTTTEFPVVRVFRQGRQVEELTLMILVVILVMAWVAILGPGWWRHRSERGVDSISHFHRQLRVLQLTGASPLVDPACRLQSASEYTSARLARYPDVAQVPVLTVVGADQIPTPALAFLGEAGEELPSPPVVAAPRSVDPYARQLARKRRRDTLMTLACIFAGTLLIGCIPAARVAWVVTAVTAVVLVAYVALLVHMCSLATEREQKLHYLEPRAHGGADAELGEWSAEEAYDSRDRAAAR